MRRLVFVVFAILLSACAKGATAPSPELTESVLVGPLLIHVGDTVNVSVALFNAGDQPLQYAPQICGQAFHVFDAFGNQVDASTVCPGLYELVPATLEPGDQLVYQGRWVADSALSGLDTPMRVPLPAGTYTIRGDIHVLASVLNRATTGHVTK